MKKLVISFLAILSCVLLTGCIGIFESKPVNTPRAEEPQISAKDDSKVAINAIKSAMKDDEWVRNNLMLKKSTFGDDAHDDQELTFRKLGKDRVIVNAYAYEETFGVANTIVSYKDGVVRTFSEPSLDQPGHPGHIGYAVDPENEILVGYYMHMGFYENVYYKILDDKLELIADFEGTENNYDGTLLEDEDGTPLVKYTIKIGDEEEEGITTFTEYEEKVRQYADQYSFESINIPLTDENIDELQ